MRKIIGSIACMAMVTLLSVGNAAGATCSPRSIGELQEILKQHAPFDGTWKTGNGFSGPVGFTKSGGSFKFQESNINKQKLPWTPVRVKFLSPTKFTFRTAHGTYTLRLTKSCALTGTQKHRTGSNISISLR